MDDDEQFDDDYLQKNLAYRETYRKVVGKDFVLCPTLMHRKTGKVQNYGFSHFNYRMSRPVPACMGDKERISVQMYSGNSLFAPAYLFQQHLFDEQLDFVAEDLDFSRGLTFDGYPIIVLRDLKIYHMEGEKTLLQQARVGNPYAAYRK
jgi:GT2 family glycosyltransferase